MAWRLLKVCIICLPSLAGAAELVRDEAVIMDLLENGSIILSEDAARTMPAEESQRRIRKIGLEKNNLRIHAAFRDKAVRVAGKNEGVRKYYDAYYNELAAYIVSRYLGLNIVPATVLRSIPISAQGLRPSAEPLEGTLQLWIENTAVEYELQNTNLRYPGDPMHRNQQLKEIRIFDCIIGNVDRHAGNLLIDFNQRFPKGKDSAGQPQPYLGKIWAIDHSRAFHRSARVGTKHCQLRKLDYQAVSLIFIQRMRSWQRADVERALGSSGLSDRQLARLNLDALDRRLKKVREHLEAAQKTSKLSDEEFFSSGVWHSVW